MLADWNTTLEMISDKGILLSPNHERNDVKDTIVLVVINHLRKGSQKQLEKEKNGIILKGQP